MKIIKNQEIVEDDWQHLNPEDANASYPIASEISEREVRYTLLDFPTWLALSPVLKAEVPGLLLSPEDELNIPAKQLDHVEVIGIAFKAGEQQRSRKQAQQLREGLEFTGEIRAIEPDTKNLKALSDAGFDSFNLACSEAFSIAVSQLSIELRSDNRQAA